MSVAQIKEWNNLKSTTIFPNQILYIYTDDRPVKNGSSLRFPADQAAVSSSGKVNMTTTRPRDNTPVSKSPSQIEMEKHKTSYHTVRKGETLYSISKRYPGSTVNGIIKSNNLNKKGIIYPGQVLEVKQY